jgi:pectate lyase
MERIMKKQFLPFSLSLIFLAIPAFAAITEFGGGMEMLHVKWAKDPCAARYNVYYLKGGESRWMPIDNELIREYSDHFRADILGISAGSYSVRVVPVNNGTEGTAMTANNIAVAALERAGFAFMNGAVPGAYKADGTLKDSAVVVYITNQNKDNITLAVRTSSNRSTTLCAGLEDIIKKVESGYENRPLAFRFIGKVTDSNFTLSQGGGDIVIKDNNRREDAAYSYITFEGVGDDAVLYGWAVRTSRARNLQIRNLGFMLTNSTGGDNIEINTDSRNIWIHNNDMFYGNPGSDADQVKGDGATDVKASTCVTIAYNHYWENGKTHLLGNSASEAPGYITLHHNWYDHSDSRHPRARKHYVHVYNNYYDGVATYGIGAVMQSSIFAERNYFRDTNRPMMISRQGTDIASGSGTFSNEDGGMIKAFGNFMDSYSGNSSRYRPYSSSNTVEFDAYEVGSASAAVPSAVTAKQGGGTFNNDMMAGYPAYISLNDSAAIRTRVTSYAGRYNGGDFRFAFTSSDAASSSVNAALKSALQNYKSGLVRIQDANGDAAVACQIDTAAISECALTASVYPPNSGDASFTDIAGNITVTAAPNGGYTFQGWSITVDGAERPALDPKNPITIPAAAGCDVSMVAHFTEDAAASASWISRAAPSFDRLNIARSGNGFRVRYAVKNKGAVRIDLFDMKGVKTRTLVSAQKNAGAHSEYFSADGLTAGTYLVKLRAGRQVLQERFIVAK